MLENKHSLENHAICTNIPMFVLKTKTLRFVFLSRKKMQICKLSKLDVDRLRSACHLQAWRLTVWYYQSAPKKVISDNLL